MKVPFDLGDSRKADRRELVALIKASGNSIGIWISAGCSVLTLVSVIWFLGTQPNRSGVPVVQAITDPSVIPIKVVELPPVVQAAERGSEEAKTWIGEIEKVMASGKTTKVVSVDGNAPMRKVLGPNMPLEKIEWVEIQPNGSFSLQFLKEHFFDYPLAESKGNNKYARIQIAKGLLSGKMVNGQTGKNKFPVKLLVFAKPEMITIDPLDQNHESTVPGIAKMMGVLPQILVLVCHRNEKGWLMAPQLGGQGASENSGLMRDLLKLNDTIDPKLYAKL